MSTKSILTITLDPPLCPQDDLDRLKMLVGDDLICKIRFSGWTYWATIGDVQVPATFNELFDAFDSASRLFLPIIYKFKGMKLWNNSIWAVYYPDDMEILVRFRGHMASKGISFTDNPREPFFAIEVDLDNIGQLTNRTTVESFVPKQTEVQFLAVSVLNFRRHKTRLYRRATINNP